LPCHRDIKIGIEKKGDTSGKNQIVEKDEKIGERDTKQRKHIVHPDAMIVAQARGRGRGRGIEPGVEVQSVNQVLLGTRELVRSHN
jgi:hypothetical protein